jgi:hypothetical protein
MATFTTLNAIRAHSPCADGWVELLRHLGKTQADDEPLALTTILDSNGLTDALWCLRACDGIDREARLYAVWCARQVQHLMADPRSLAALDVAERHANGRVTDDELAAAKAAAAAAWDAARGVASDAAMAALDVAERHANGRVTDDELAAARGVALDAAMAAASAAAKAAAAAAWDAARGVASDAAKAAAPAAAKAAAWDDARGAAMAEALAEARAAQTAKFRQFFG